MKIRFLQPFCLLVLAVGAKKTAGQINKMTDKMCQNAIKKIIDVGGTEGFTVDDEAASKLLGEILEHAATEDATFEIVHRPEDKGGRYVFEGVPKAEEEEKETPKTADGKDKKLKKPAKPPKAPKVPPFRVPGVRLVEGRPFVAGQIILRHYLSLIHI